MHAGSHPVSQKAVSLIGFSFLVSGQKSQEPGGEQRLCWCGQNLTVDNLLHSRGLTVDSLTEYCSAVEIRFH